MKYRTIIFDLFGTLIENMLSYQYREMLFEVSDILSIEQDWFINLWLEYSDDRMTGVMNNADCLSLVCNETGLEPSEETFRNCLNVFADQVRSRLAPTDTTLTVLSNLRERGYDIGLISNCSDEVSSLWNESTLATIIQDPVFSYSVGMKKPDQEIYLVAAEKTGATACECIFVDDSIEYLEGARKAGMHGVLIQDRTLNSSLSNPDDWDGYSVTSVVEMEALLNNME